MKYIRNLRAADCAGFTLIELMITVAIIAILSTIAVPQYFEFLKHTRRSDATSTLQDLLAKEALFYGNFGGTYTSDVTDLGYVAVDGNTNQLESEDSHYLLTVSSCDATGLSECVSIVATPNSDSQQKDLGCTSFSLNSRGTQQATALIDGSSESTAEIRESCWK